MSTKFRRTIAVAAGAVILSGVGLVVAPSATAVGGHSQCWEDTPDRTASVTGGSVNLRSGPGTSYASLGLVTYGTSFRIICTQPGPEGFGWDYGQVWSGPNAGKWGWVAMEYTS